MKFSVDVKKLKNAISHSARLTGKHVSLPVLESILIQVTKKEVIFRSTNLHIGMEVSVPATVEEEGVVAIPGSTLLSLVNSLSGDGDVVFSTQHENILIVKGGSRALVKTVPHEDFPTLPKVEGGIFSIDTQILSNGISSVLYSAAVSDIKQELSSVYLYTEENELYFVATDSFRLAEKKIKVNDLPDIDKIIIPLKSATELTRIISELNGQVKVIFNKNQISFTSSGVYITSRLIDSNFPDYKQILPKNKTTECIVLTQDILNTLKATVAFSDKFNQITFHIKPDKKQFIIESKNSDVGEYNTDVPATIEGKEIDINLNYRYFLDAFHSITSDSVSIRFTEANKPILLAGVGQKDFLYLIMPLHR